MAEVYLLLYTDIIVLTDQTKMILLFYLFLVVYGKMNGVGVRLCLLTERTQVVKFKIKQTCYSLRKMI